MSDNTLLELTRKRLEDQARERERQRIAEQNAALEDLAESHARQVAREALLASIIEKIVHDAINQFVKEQVAGSTIVRLSVRKRWLGVLWYHDVTESTERVGWYIGSLQAKPCFFICDNGEVGVVPDGSNKHRVAGNTYADRAAILRRLNASFATPRAAAILTDIAKSKLRKVFVDPAFDESFCKYVFQTSRESVQVTLGLTDATPPPVIKFKRWGRRRSNRNA